MNQELSKIMRDNEIDGKKMCSGEAIEIFLKNGVDFNIVLYVMQEWKKEIIRNGIKHKDNVE